MKYSLITFGCQMNISDSERLTTVLEQMGFEHTEDEEHADLLGIVACSVRQKAIDKVYTRIYRWNKQKSRKHLITFLTGCVLDDDKAKFLKLFDLVFPINDITELPDMIRQYGVPGPMSNMARGDLHSAGTERDGTDPDRATGFWNVHPRHTTEFEAYVPIQNGCNNFCAYCAVPYTRGREVSRASEDVIAEVTGLIDSGYKSITLLGQNVNSYGLDTNGHERSFAELLCAIGDYGESTKADFWLYFTSPHPKDMGNDVLSAVARYRCLANQIHLPIQSGSSDVLSRMKRGYTAEGYRRVAGEVRRILPDAAVFTDIIVGFPGETEADFEATRAAMEEYRYWMAYIAMYSPRPGSSSAEWADDVPLDEKKRRLHVLSQDLQRIAREHHEGMVGHRYKALVMGEDRRAGYLSAKTEGKTIIRFPSESKTLIGQFVEVDVTAAAAMSAEGAVSAS